MSIARPKAVRTLAAIAAIGVIATGCSSDRDNGGDSGGSGSTGTFVFGAAGDPASLDPSLASDGETFRVTRQVFETLIDHKPGTSELEGGLAETWESNDAGTEWTFNLRDGVTFHDGSDLTGEVVCANFDRWYNWSGTYQNTTLSYYWQTIFGGFANNENDETPEANYVGCTAPDELTAVIEVAQPSANYPGGFSLAAFGIHSGPALERTPRTTPAARATPSPSPATARRPAPSPAPARSPSTAGTRATARSASPASTTTGARPRASTSSSSRPSPRNPPVARRC